MTIQARCPHCKKMGEFDSGKSLCLDCGKDRMPFITEKYEKEGVITQCLVCGCPQVYRQKDFNRKLGIGILMIGIALSYFTFGISLAVVTVIDFLLYRFVGELGVCYRCGALYRESAAIPLLEPFNLVLYDHYRSLSD